MNKQTNESCSCCAPISIDLQSITPTQSVTHCPECSQHGKKVDGATVKSMLRISLREVQDTQYFFCRTENCHVVYFNEDGKQTFKKTDIRERVYQKEPLSPDVLICYCFQHTPESIRIEMVEMGKSTVVDDINAGIQAGQCACDWRNPQGSCCLGNVKTLVKSIEDEITSTKA